MTAAEFFGDVVDLLEAGDVAFMVAGSFASSFYGDARTTRDLDLVVEIDEHGVARLASAVDPTRWYLDRQSLLTAAHNRSMCNMIDMTSGWKADLIVRKDRPFSREEFRRRQSVELFDRRVAIATAEDVILTKLEWAAMGTSQRQYEDVAGIIAVHRDALDVDYLRQWAPELGVVDLLASALMHKPWP